MDIKRLEIKKIENGYLVEYFSGGEQVVSAYPVLEAAFSHAKDLMSESTG